ncbi:hypothetical protein IAU59_003590 [Kwoniella sp. CBS 9459]
MAPKRKPGADGPSTRTRSTTPSPTKRFRTTITSAIASGSISGGRPSPSGNKSRSPSKFPITKKIKYKYKSRPTNRSIWNSTDDWETLVSNSTLSTSSISLRPPRFGGGGIGLPSLTRCCTRCIARHFKGLWEADAAQGSAVADAQVTMTMGEDFRLAWKEVPDRLKEAVRDEVIEWWGGYLALRMIIDVFMVPPHMYLPGELLPSVASTDRLKDLIPSTASSREAYTSLTLTHADKVTDTGVAGLIYHLPNLERINLKGCQAVGSRTIKTMVDRCKKLKRVNLMGTGVREEDIKVILDAFGQQLEGFKVDKVNFESINHTFASASITYPHLTHLCLPGSLLSPAHGGAASRARLLASSIGHPEARPTPPSSILQWETLGETFPALTHLSLPGLLVVEGTKIALPPGLIKFSVLPSGSNAGSGTNTGGPPISIETITNLLESQTTTLRSVHLGHLKPSTRGTAALSNPRSSAFYANAEREFRRLGEVLAKCENLQSFKWVNQVGGSLDTGCDLASSRFADLVYEPGLAGSWRRSLKHLTLVIPQTISAWAFLPANGTVSTEAAELDIVSTQHQTHPDHSRIKEGREDEQSLASMPKHVIAVPMIILDEDKSSPARTDDFRSPLETLNIPSANIDDTAQFARAVSGFRALRTMDLSGTKITDDDMRTIVGSCTLLHRIDLTSCRGVNVRHRRNIFKRKSVEDLH